LKATFLGIGHKNEKTASAAVGSFWLVHSRNFCYPWQDGPRDLPQKGTPLLANFLARWPRLV